VSACIDLSERAGDLIRKVHASGHLNTLIKGVTSGGVDDPVTEADLQSQKIIIGGLRNVWADLHIVGEENCEVPNIDLIPSLTLSQKYDFPENLKNINSDDITIFLDPLDATREFTLGNVECVTTLIGISINGIAVAGVIHQPFVGANGRTVWGVVGLGVVGIVKDLLLTTSPLKDMSGVRLITTSSHNSSAVDKAILKIKPDSVIRAGGAGFKVLMLLEGKADVYIYPTSGCKLWDTCAPHALVNALSGTMTDAEGNNIEYFKSSEINVHKGVLVALRDHHIYLRQLQNT